MDKQLPRNSAYGQTRNQKKARAALLAQYRAAAQERKSLQNVITLNEPISEPNNQ